MEIGNVTYRINHLVRTLQITIYDWGVHVLVRDKADDDVNTRFTTKRFRITKTCKTIEDNITRAMKYYNAPQDQIEVMQKYYKDRKELKQNK